MKCEGYVARLRAMQTVNEEQFLADAGLQWQVERGLQLATQACIDMADEILFQLEKEEPETAADAFYALRAADLLEANLADQLVECVGFRNVLVHDYADLDLAETFRHWQRDLSCYERFCRLVRAWITGTAPAATPTQRASPRSPGHLAQDLRADDQQQRSLGFGEFP